MTLTTDRLTLSMNMDKTVCYTQTIELQYIVHVYQVILGNTSWCKFYIVVRDQATNFSSFCRYKFTAFSQYFFSLCMIC